MIARRSEDLEWNRYNLKHQNYVKMKVIRRKKKTKVKNKKDMFVNVASCGSLVFAIL